MLPFGETLLVWRLARGMSQGDLAQAAHMSRPNLSAIERGDREVTLRTLRRLALALEVRPGVLVDGIPPTTSDRPLGRRALEHIAGAAAQRVGLTRDGVADRAGETRLATLLAEAAAVRIASLPAPPGGGTRGAVRRPGRRSDRAYLLLKSATSSETVDSLVNRLSGPSSGNR
jgi:transcriptional regulator with XRE-family HTH domain